MLIDQHAASERIYYEKFIQFYNNEKNKKEKYYIKGAKPFTLSHVDTTILLENKEFFKEMGFDIEVGLNNTFILSSIPIIFKDRNIIEIILEIINAIRHDKGTFSLDSKTIKMLQFLACRTAIKAGDTITKQQMKKLITELENTGNSYVCAHGRPTKIEITKYELERMFKRV